MTTLSPSSDVAFSPSVKAIQARKGSRDGYAHADAKRGWPTTITNDLAQFIAAQTSAYLATVNADGWPYIQHRGGPAGFLKVLGPHLLGFADFKGNRQLLSTGNVAGNDRVALFLMDYPRRERLKIWRGLGFGKGLELDGLLGRERRGEVAEAGAGELRLTPMPRRGLSDHAGSARPSIARALAPRARSRPAPARSLRRSRT